MWSFFTERKVSHFAQNICKFITGTFHTLKIFMSNNQYVFIWVVFRGKNLRPAHLLLIPGISHDVEPNMTNGPYASNQYPLPAVYKWFCKMFSSFSSFSCWVSSSFSSWVATSTTSLSSNTPPSRRNRRLIEVMRICDRKTDPAVEGSDRVTHCGVCHIRATNPSFSHCYLHIFFRGWNTLLHIHKSCLLPKKTDGLLGDPPALRYTWEWDFSPKYFLMPSNLSQARMIQGLKSKVDQTFIVAPQILLQQTFPHKYVTLFVLVWNLSFLLRQNTFQPFIPF